MTPDDERTGGGGSRLMVEWRAVAERFRTSLFGLPSVWLVGSVVLWVVMRWVDGSADPDKLPGVLATTVDSARALLGAVASGTITAASVVFSLTLVAIQLSSNTYSSRVLRTFLRDRFQQNMMGVVLATFFYSLLVLRDVRGPLNASGEANVPSASISLAVLLGLASILALLASISHTSRSVRVAHVSASLRKDTHAVIADRLGKPRTDGDPGAGATPAPFDVQAPGVTPSPLAVAVGGSANTSEPPHDATPYVITTPQGGWVQQISLDALTHALETSVPAGSLVRLEVAVGTYVFAGGPLVTVWSAASDDPEGGTHREGSPHAAGQLRQEVRAAIRIGGERTMQQDVAFGLTMLEDIALRALSPGINDPNTAGEIILQLGELLLEILMRDLPPVRLTVGGITIIRAASPGYLDYLEASFGQIRRVTETDPVVRLTMIRTLATIAAELERRDATVPEAMAALRVSITRLLSVQVDPGDPAVVEATELVASTAWYGSGV